MTQWEWWEHKKIDGHMLVKNGACDENLISPILPQIDITNFLMHIHYILWERQSTIYVKYFQNFKPEFNYEEVLR